MTSVPGNKSAQKSSSWSFWAKVTLAFLIAAFAFVSFFVWIPDVITKRHMVIAECKLANGDHVQLAQYWNSFDFYTLYLVHRSSTGQALNCVVLDGDAPRTWHGRVAPEQSGEKVAVSTHFHRGYYDPVQRHLITRSGAVRVGSPPDNVIK